MPKLSVFNPQYAAERTKLIPQAEFYAEEMCKTIPEGEVHSTWWNKCYFRRMDELAQEKGLVG